MKTLFILAAVLAYASARVYFPTGYSPQSIAANQASNAIGGAGSTVVASGTANAAGSRVKREPQYYPSYGGYGYGGYNPQSINANQNSNAYGGYGSTVLADGTANAYGQRWKRSPGYYPGYGYGGYAPQNIAANQNSNAVGGPGSTVVATGTANAAGNRWKRSPQYYGGYPGYGYGNYAPQNIGANQASNAVGGAGSTVVATGTANAAGQRWKRSPQYYGGYPGYGYGNYAPQNIGANQASNAVGGAGSTVVASGTANAAGQRWKRSPQYYPGGYPVYPGYGYGGYRPQTVTANQASNAVGGAGSTVVASGTSNAGAERVKREPQYYGSRYPGYGYGGYAPQNVAANQNSNAVGGIGSTVVATGTANANGNRFKREPVGVGAYPYYGYGYYPYNYGGFAPQSITANQASNAVGGDGSTVVSSGTSNAGGSME